MRCAIIPPEKLEFFDIQSTTFPFLRVGPVSIHSGPHAGSYAVNEAILTSCPEWEALAETAIALCATHGVPILEIDPADLVNPDSPQIP
jgi:hypothetical protein